MLAALAPSFATTHLLYSRGGQTISVILNVLGGRKLIPNMRQISRGVKRYIIILRISLQVSEMFIKNVIFWHKK
jgi:hypothetical protein